MRLPAYFLSWQRPGVPPLGPLPRPASLVGVPLIKRPRPLELPPLPPASRTAVGPLALLSMLTFSAWSWARRLFRIPGHFLPAAAFRPNSLEPSSAPAV